MRRMAGIRTFCKLLVVLGILFVAPGMASAQTPALTCDDWSAVDKWTGTVTVNGSGTASDQFGNSYTLQESATIQFVSSSNPGNCGGLNLNWAWDGQLTDVKYSVNIQDQENTTCLDKDNNPHPYKITYSVSNGSYSQRAAQIGVDFQAAASPVYFFGALQSVDGVHVSYMPDAACGSGASAVMNELLPCNVEILEGSSVLSTSPRSPNAGPQGSFITADAGEPHAASGMYETCTPSTD